MDNKKKGNKEGDENPRLDLGYNSCIPGNNHIIIADY